MKSEQKALVGLALGSAVLGTVIIMSRAKAAPPPPPPEPGLANLYGKVTELVTGVAIPDVLVNLNGTQTYTDSEGNYYILNVVPGPYTLEFSKSGYETLVF